MPVVIFKLADLTADEKSRKNRAQHLDLRKSDATIDPDRGTSRRLARAIFRERLLTNGAGKKAGLLDLE